MGEHHELRHAKLARNKVMLENALAQDTAQECGNGKNHDRERHEEVFMDVPFGNGLAAGCPVEGEEEQAEHVEGRKAAGEEGETEYDVVLPLECREDNFVLREESGERRDARNGENANQGAPVGERHLFAESTHGVQVVRMHLVNQATCNQE